MGERYGQKQTGFIDSNPEMSINCPRLTIDKMKPLTSYTEIESAVRQALCDSEQSLRGISRETEISKSHLANFKNDQRNLSFPNLTKLADYFKIRYNLKNY